MVKWHEIGIRRLFWQGLIILINLVICCIMVGCGFKSEKIIPYIHCDEAKPADMKIALILPLNTEIGKEALLAVRCGIEDFFVDKEVGIFVINNFGTKQGSAKAAKVANDLGVDVVLGPISGANTRVLMNKIRRGIKVISYANREGDIALGFDVIEQVKTLPLADYKNILLVLPACAVDLGEQLDIFANGQKVEKVFIDDVKDQEFVEILNRWAVPTLEEDLEEAALKEEEQAREEMDDQEAIVQEPPQADEYLGAVVLVGMPNPRVVVDSIAYYGVNIAGMRNKERPVTALMGSSMWLERLVNFDRKFVGGVFTSTIKQTPNKLEKRFASVGLKPSYTSRLCYSSVELLALVPSGKVRDVRGFLYAKKEFDLSAGKLINDSGYLHWQYHNYQIKISRRSKHKKGLVLVRQ